MALLINESIKVFGIQLDQLYIRFKYNVNQDGNKITYKVIPYYNKEAYKNSSIENILNISNFNTNFSFYYNRQKNGNDILNLIHEHFIKEISSDIIKSIPKTNEKTQEITVEKVIVKPKFTDIENIKIIDI